MLEQVVKENYQLLIIADDLDEEILKTLVINKSRGTFSVAAVKSPGYGDRRREMLKDIAILTGGTVFPSSQVKSLEEVTVDMLGRVGEARITKDSTLISYAKGDENEIKERLSYIKNEYEKSTSDFDREKLMQRYDALNKGVAIILAGGVSETEIQQEAREYEELLQKVQEVRTNGMPHDIASYMDAAMKQLEAKIQSADADEKCGIELIQGIIKQLNNPR